MEKVALVECQLLTIPVLRLVVVESFDDFLRRDNRKGAFRGEGMVGWRLLLLVTLERSADGLVPRELAHQGKSVDRRAFHVGTTRGCCPILPC